MLNGLAIICTILWLGGVYTGHTGWGAIHGLLIVAVAVLVMDVHSWWLGRRLSTPPFTSRPVPPHPPSAREPSHRP